MNIKLIYKVNLIKDLILNKEYTDFLMKNNIKSSGFLSSFLLFLQEFIGIDFNDYVFAKEFIIQDNEILINLKEADYKKINREDKIKNILSYGNK
jgi:hypothetical protein